MVAERRGSSPKPKMSNDKKSISASESKATPIKVLTSAGVENIANHKYVPGKYTPLDNILNPWWLWLVECLPLWLAPNLVTLLGFIPLVFVYVAYWYVDPTGSEPLPSWLLFVGSFALFGYQTFDAMDGKQARRTKSSTPLGQLMDHGCDCLATISHHSQAVAALCTGVTSFTVMGLLAPFTAFFLAQWEEFHTGVLQTAAGPVGVTETQYGLIVSLAACALAGQEKHGAFVKASIAHIGGTSWQVNEMVMSVWCLFVAILIVLCFRRVIKACKEKGTIGLAFQQLLPIIALNVLALAFQPAIRSKYCRWVLLVVGLHFFYLTAQVIVFSMAHQPFPLLQKTTLPLLGLVAASYYVPDFFMPLAVVYTAGFGSFVALWVYSAGDQIATKLQIKVFKLKPIQ
jgi:phosphatidylglycerophosphate synthase